MRSQKLRHGGNSCGGSRHDTSAPKTPRTALTIIRDPADADDRSPRWRPRAALGAAIRRRSIRWRKADQSSCSGWTPLFVQTPSRAGMHVRHVEGGVKEVVQNPLKYGCHTSLLSGRSMKSDGSDLRAQRIDLLRYVGRRVDDAAVREDIVQEAYLRLISYQAEAGNTVTNVVAFLRRISCNLANDYFRRAGRSTTVDVSEDLPCPRSDLERQAEQRQLIGVVSATLRKMPLLRRQVFISRRLLGQSAKEVADLLGISPSAVDAHVARAVLDLHHAMERLEVRGQSERG